CTNRHVLRHYSPCFILGKLIKTWIRGRQHCAAPRDRDVDDRAEEQEQQNRQYPAFHACSRNIRPTACPYSALRDGWATAAPTLTIAPPTSSSRITSSQRFTT